MSYEDSPLYTLMEAEVCENSRKIIGYPPVGDGIFLSGGSQAIITAMYVARCTKFPETILKGLQSKNLKLTAFMSENGHYSTQKGAILQGLGFVNVVIIPADHSGGMDVSKLEAAVEQEKALGSHPFFVVATAGTTVLGKFDCVQDIVEVCQKHDLWLHIDGSLGLGYMFSETQFQEKLAHCKYANSVNYNMHKTIGLTPTGSVLLFRDQGLLQKTLATPSGICWERRPNILKLWLSWKAKGSEGLGQHVDYTFRLKDLLLCELTKWDKRTQFEVIKNDFDSPVVCFYYLPKELREISREAKEYKEKLEKVATEVQKRMVTNGFLIGTYRDGNGPKFLKLNVMSSGTTESDIIHFLNALDYYCCDIQVLK